MSGQMPDVIVHGGDEYVLAEPESGTIFDVRAHGVAPVMISSANSRGELARYRIDDDGRLLLSDLQVGSIDAPPAINGVEATTDEYRQLWTYLELDLPVEWSGDILAGAGPIIDLYVHAGFPPVWHYEKVVAFDIEAGVVQSFEDRTEQVAEFRASRLGADGRDEDEGVFERFLDSIKLKLGFGDDPTPGAV